MSWVLRELVHYDADAATQFLATHESVLGKRILREVRNKLRTGHKNPKSIASS